MARYQAVLLDLFGTLVLPELTSLPVMEIGGARVRTTLGALGPLLESYAPGVRPEVFWHALAAGSEEMLRRRLRDHVQEPSRERFRRAPARRRRHGSVSAARWRGAGATPARAARAAWRSRAHHRAIGDATTLPES